MQAIAEIVFNVLYLSLVTTVGFKMILGHKGSKQYLLFGIMAITLGFGDAFHLVPRAYALATTGLSNFTVALGIGKMITSITMTIFYILLYQIWRLRYKIQGKNALTITLYALASLRIALCFFPQNAWTSAQPPVLWGIYRNIPFAIIGIIVLCLFYAEATRKNDTAFKYMWLTIVLSFAFYIPVVLWADIIPIVGILMIPKTCAYVWMILMGYFEMKKGVKAL